MMDNVDRANYSLVHEYPGGAPALAEALYSQYNYSIRPGTLMNKANPDQEHQFTVREGLLIQRIQKRYLLLHAEAHQLRHAVVPLGEFADTSDTELLETYTRLHQTIGSLATAIHEAIADKVITGDEFYRIRACNAELIRAALEMEQRFEALAEDLPRRRAAGKPYGD